MASGSIEKRIKDLQLLLEARNKVTNHGLALQEWFNDRYPWQHQFIKDTTDYSEVCLCAANRIGKTQTGIGIDAVHATGLYPEGWDGHKFTHPPLIWILGYSMEKCRDLLQFPLVGRKVNDTFTGGLIPVELIEGYEGASGVPNACRTLFIRHASGGIAKIQFWSYSQGAVSLMGDSVDFFHIDEEPKDQTIYPQVLTRTATGDKGRGGRGILTFTPENGRTQLVTKFMDDPGSGQVFIMAGWDDAPHLSEETKTKLMESFPAHQKDMRTKGIPMLGHGRIYDLAEEFITCAPFAIPKHWMVINGMDFGFTHPQSHIELVINPDTEDYYVTKVWKQSQCSASDAWSAVKSWCMDAPTAWPHDGLQTEKGSGKQQKRYYEEAGFNLLPKHAHWPDGQTGVEAGIFEILDLMRKGKFKVFDGCRGFIDEFLEYHRDERGKIYKLRDDILDAVRYAYMMRRYAIRYGDLGKNMEDDLEHYHVPSGVG